MKHSFRNCFQGYPTEHIFKDKPNLLQINVWYLQPTSRYLSQSWPRFMSPYSITTPHRGFRFYIWKLFTIFPLYNVFFLIFAIAAHWKITKYSVKQSQFCNSYGTWKIHIFYYAWPYVHYVFTRGLFWPPGIVVACVCPSFRPSVRPSPGLSAR